MGLRFTDQRLADNHSPQCAPRIVHTFDKRPFRQRADASETQQTSAVATLSGNSTTTVVTQHSQWTSSNPAVATVVDGLVTAVALGSTQITAAYGGAMAIREIDVKVSSFPATRTILSTAAFNDRFQSRMVRLVTCATPPPGVLN
jgi:hypothetical protein